VFIMSILLGDALGVEYVAIMAITITMRLKHA